MLGISPDSSTEGDSKLNPIPSQVESDLPSAASPPNVPRPAPKHEQLEEALQALAIPARFHRYSVAGH